MLKGIDISNWQNSISLNELHSHNSIDFVIAKATEGLSYVDKTCDKYVQDTIKRDKLFGFYHFARANDPRLEAEFFVDMCEGYLGKGIPVLDLEDMAIRNWREYADNFCKRFHDLTNIWPMIYISAGNIPYVRGCYVSDTCALWVAGYPSPYRNWSQLKQPRPPYTLNPWKTWTIWQFTSSGKLEGYAGELDLDFANLDRDGWMRIAKGERVSLSNDLTDALGVVADHVIAGEFGNGDERKQKVYDAVQEQVNLRVIY